MLTIGVTGGIGSGKSTVTGLIEEYGAKVILADEIAKEVVEPGKPAYKRIIEHFGAGIVDENGKINRKKLGDIVFSNESELMLLNRITHGFVAEEIRKELQKFQNEGVKLAVVEAVVPICHGFLDVVDTVWVVVSSEAVRLERIMKRDGFTKDEAMLRIRAQMSDAEYKSIADKVILNNGTYADLRKQIRSLLEHENYSRS